MANYKLHITDSAHEYSDRIMDYLIERSPSAAYEVFRALDAAYQRLTTFPLMGPEAQEWELRKSGYRKLVVGDYVTLYRVVDDVCVIDHIFHGKQNYQGRFSNREE